MSDYLIWREYTPGHQYASVQSETGIELEEIQAIRRGRRLEPAPERVTITSLTAGTLPDVMSSGWGGRYISLGVRRILEKHGRPQDLQLIPAELAPTLGDRGHALWLLNVTATGAYFDREASDFDPSPRAPAVVRVVRRMALRPIPEGAPAILHLEELISVLLIRPDLAGELEEKVSTPGDFLPVSEYTRGGA